MIDVGGGFRAIYGAGVMDRMLEDGISVDHCYGVSAGSANMVSFIAKQHGRNHTFYTQYAFRKEYASFDSYVKNHNFANLDYVYSTLSNHDGENPVDYAAFEANPTGFTGQKGVSLVIVVRHNEPYVDDIILKSTPIKNIQDPMERYGLK